MTDRAAVVLAGGFATRFEDGDKTLATLDGRPLLVHACEPLAAVTDELLVSCRHEQVETFEGALAGAGVEGVRFRPDETPDRGPLAGLGDALAGTDASAVAVAAADMPCVPAGLWRALFDRLDSADAVAVVEDGFRQPAPAAFRTGPLSEAVAAGRAAGEKRLRAVFEGLSVETVPAGDVRERWGEHALADVNTLADLGRVRDRGGTDR